MALIGQDGSATPGAVGYPNVAGANLLTYGGEGQTQTQALAGHAAEHMAMGMPYRFSDFTPSLLPSLVAGATASRSGDVVTVSATAHGITTGAAYTGFRIFYPGSPSLSAGWYESILSVPDANTLTFSAPGANFGSESVNGGAAWITQTDIASLIIPANTLIDNSRVTVHGYRSGDTSSAQKMIRVLQNGLHISIGTVTTFPASAFSHSFLITQGGTKAVGCAAADSSVTSTEYIQATNVQNDISLTVRGSVSAASGFFVVHSLLCMVGA